MHPPGRIERILIAIGCGCLIAVGVEHAQAASFQWTASDALERELTRPQATEVSDTGLSSVALADLPAPGAEGLIGRLEIPRLEFSVMVLEGDDHSTLARAVGHVPGTAFPWQPGNVVMAGHRDTFFRPLENLRSGDEIRMTTARGTFDYRVTSTEIVEPNDVSVLAPSANPSLTLVTCYPFVYVGPAPQRFIIHAQ
jgi:sortase A